MSFAVKAVVFDWAGTMIDFGCMAPVEALQRAFESRGIALSVAEARADMGKAKIDHLRAILAAPDMRARWAAKTGRTPSEADTQGLFADLEPAMREAAAKSATLIAGAADVVRELRALGVRIGSGTGYTREMMTPILKSAAAQGYEPELVVCSGETPSGRPAPLMTWKALIALDAWPASACIKVDDAPVGIEEGRNAGCWTVGLSGSGNEMGLDRERYAALAPQEKREKLAQAARVLKDAGANFVIEDISQLMPVVHEIAKRIDAR